MIEDTCKKIKEKRHTLGYSLEYVVEKTKLHPSVIRDIEAGNLRNINAAYLRGFVKIYAAFLDVDLGNALEEIDDLKKEQEKPKIVKIIKDPPKPVEDKQPDKPGPVFHLQKNIIAAVIGIVLLALILLVGVFIVRAISGMFAKPAVSGRQKAEKEEVVFDQIGELTVSLTAKKKCFIRVVVDGKLLFEGVIEKGAVESWKADKEIEFKISDGSAVYLEINGKSVPTLTAIRKPIKSLKITPSGISVDK